MPLAASALSSIAGSYYREEEPWWVRVRPGAKFMQADQARHHATNKHHQAQAVVMGVHAGTSSTCTHLLPRLHTSHPLTPPITPYLALLR